MTFVFIAPNFLAVLIRPKLDDHTNRAILESGKATRLISAIMRMGCADHRLLLDPGWMKVDLQKAGPRARKRPFEDVPVCRAPLKRGSTKAGGALDLIQRVGVGLSWAGRTNAILVPDGRGSVATGCLRDEILDWTPA